MYIDGSECQNELSLSWIMYDLNTKLFDNWININLYSNIITWRFCTY